ncbi:MAG: 50S ribosomal protein L11 methyltransferase [Acidimicrobiales bacterium]
MTTTRQVVEVQVDHADAELAADVLWQGAPSAVGEENLGDGRVRLTADVIDPGVLDELPPGAVVTILELDGADYLDRWRAFATPARAGRNVVIQPAWIPVAETVPTDLVVLIDPGRTFGSGSHPTTRLVIAAIEEHLREGDRVLDVGAGSGVLAVVACLLGASTALAIDIDPQAVEVTEANALSNGVEDRVTVLTTPLADLRGAFEMVVANIGAAVVCDLADALLARLASGGVLILAGILDSQADQVVYDFGAVGEWTRCSEDGWTALVLASR